MRRTAGITLTASAATSISSYPSHSHSPSPRPTSPHPHSPSIRSPSPNPPSPKQSPKQSLTSKASLRTSPHPPPSSASPSVAASPYPPIPIPPSVASTASASPVSAAYHTPASKANTSSPITHSANAMPTTQSSPSHSPSSTTQSHTPSLSASPNQTLTASTPSSRQTPNSQEKEKKKEKKKEEKPWIDPASLPTHGSVAHIAGNAPERIKHLTQNTFFAYGVGAPPTHSNTRSDTRSTTNSRSARAMADDARSTADHLHLNDGGRTDEGRGGGDGGVGRGDRDGGGGRDGGRVGGGGRDVGEWSGDDFFGYAVGRRVRLVDIRVYPSHSSSSTQSSTSTSTSTSSYNTHASSSSHASTGYHDPAVDMGGINNGVHGVERSVERLEASTTAEIEVTRGMLNGAGMLHGGCVAYLVDNCCSTPLVVLGLMQGRNGVGVTQAMNVLFHSPAAVGTTLSIVSTSISLGGRVMSSRCEIIAKETGRIVASAFLNKMQPGAAKL